MYWQVHTRIGGIIEISPIKISGFNPGKNAIWAKELERAEELCTALGFKTTPYRDSRRVYFNMVCKSFRNTTPIHEIARAMNSTILEYRHQNPIVSFMFRANTVQVILYT